MKILVSSFEPFLDAKSNCSMLVTQSLAGDPQNKDIFFVHQNPVTYKNSWENLKKYIDQEKPDVVLALGQAEASKTVALERWGLNWIESRAKDNDGLALFNQEIRGGKSLAVKTSVVLEPIYDKLKAAQIPAQISVSAGGFICNYLYYQLLLDHPRSLFVHLPLAEEQKDPCFANSYKMPLAVLCQAVQLIIHSLQIS